MFDLEDNLELNTSAVPNIGGNFVESTSEKGFVSNLNKTLVVDTFDCSVR